MTDRGNPGVHLCSAFGVCKIYPTIGHESDAMLLADTFREACFNSENLLKRHNALRLDILFAFLVLEVSACENKISQLPRL